MSKRIEVLSPRTWGEFGNYLAATRLARVIEATVEDVEVALLEVEAFLPWLGEIGAQIRQITVASPDATTLRTEYMALMDKLASQFPAAFEGAAQPPAMGETLTGLVEHFRATAPDVVIGTKGFVSRLCVAASRIAGHPACVINHVTNPGLLQLAIHRSPLVDLTLVPFSWVKTWIGALGGNLNRTRVIGPLVAQHELRAFVATDADGRDTVPWGDHDRTSRVKVIVFSNRGGDAYLRLIDHLAAREADIDLVFVAAGDPQAARRAAALAGDAGTRWAFRSRLAQDEYFEYINHASKSEHALLVAKAGPNTTLEAAYFGIPVLLLESGLPMERWVPNFVRAHQLGQTGQSVADMIDVLDCWLARPSMIASHKRAVHAFAVANLEQSRVEACVGAAVREALEASSGRLRKT